ncbi:hypothetical protein [Dongia sp.]|uniref:hypothetical protein n=1 Tax=Dongia sp. TaxID=1977262 RepID=UPI0037514BAD
MPKPTKETLTTTAAPEALPALPAKRARRRTTRASHSWRFRRPPSRKRVEVATARGLPEAAQPPAPDLLPINDSCN